MGMVRMKVAMVVVMSPRRDCHQHGVHHGNDRNKQRKRLQFGG